MFQKILISQRFGGGGKYPQPHRREEHTGADSQEHSQGAMTSGAPVDRVYIFIKIHSSILAGSCMKTRMLPPSLIRFSVLQDCWDLQAPGTTSMNLGHSSSLQNQPREWNQKSSSRWHISLPFRHTFLGLLIGLGSSPREGERNLDFQP